MSLSKKAVIVLRILAGIAISFALIIGIILGLVIAATANLGSFEDFNSNQAALPTQILDINGNVITEFFSDEKRELISIDDLPKHVIYALITREDNEFFEHQGVSIRGTIRGFVGYITGNFAGGGSTITQQLATSLYLDKSDISVTRKIQEMWLATQIERNWTKYEILEEYLNKMWFGHTTYGIEAASKFYFDHSAKDLTIAEAMLLMLQLSGPHLYSPLRNPNNARERQRDMLDQMVELGYATQEEVDISFNEYWANFDYSRSFTENAFFEREDAAPYFSEYVRYTLENEILLGSADIYKDGYRVYTTLNMDHQRSAQEHLRNGIESANRVYRSNLSNRVATSTASFSPVVDLLSLVFDIPNMRVAGEKQRQLAKQEFKNNLSPMMNALGLVFGTSNQDPIRQVALWGEQLIRDTEAANTVEGALIALENNTGYITAMVGGSNFEQSNQLNRATQAFVQPGSSFKPLYYTAAIEHEVITPSTIIYDSPIVFTNDDGTPYTPTNYRGEWVGPVLVRNALAKSMNIPSLRVLNRLGFDRAIDVTSRLLGIEDRDRLARGLERKYPIGLGVISVSPIMMAKAFATFPNQGKRVTPLAIRYIEDRGGNIIAEPERVLREEQARQGNDAQLISPQTAYIMTNMLQTTVQTGTLRYPRSLVDGFGDWPIAGKTGTTQNWSALWTVGFSPAYTAAIWIGFDEGNNSMGTNQTGAVTAGPIWARFMKDIHEDLPAQDYIRPATGLVEMEVTTAQGLIPLPGYTGSTYTEIFRQGTQPREFDRTEEIEVAKAEEVKVRLIDNLQSGALGSSTISNPLRDNDSSIISSNLDLDLEIGIDLDKYLGEDSSSSSSYRESQSNGQNLPQTYQGEDGNENPWL